MAANRTARNEAWIASVVLHVGLLAAVVAVAGRPRETEAGPVLVRTRDTGHEIGVVMLDRLVSVVPVAVRVPVPPNPQPAPQPVRPIPAPPTAAPVRTVSYQQPAVTPPPEAPTVTGPPVADVPGASESPPGSPSAAIPVANADRPPLPPGASTAFFGVPAVGKSVVFVLDRSASMGLDGRLDRARRELADSLRRLPTSARFQVVPYNKSAEPLRLPGATGLLPATPDNVAAAVLAVNGLRAEGGSEHLQALTAALALGPDVVYFLTDEDDLEARDVLSVTRLNRGRVCVHALCLVPPAGDETPMRGLARNNRGQFQVVR